VRIRALRAQAASAFRGQGLPPLDRILGSRPLLHSAEGHLSGHALASAAEAAGLPVLHVAPESTVGEGIATAASFALISAPPTPGSPQTV